jgi:hypothetical protein
MKRITEPLDLKDKPLYCEQAATNFHVFVKPEYTIKFSIK